MRCCTTQLRFLVGTDGDDDDGDGDDSGNDRDDGDGADGVVHDSGDDDRTLRGTCATLRKCRISVPGF